MEAPILSSQNEKLIRRGSIPHIAGVTSKYKFLNSQDKGFKRISHLPVFHAIPFERKIFKGLYKSCVTEFTKQCRGIESSPMNTYVKL